MLTKILQPTSQSLPLLPCILLLFGWGFTIGIFSTAHADTAPPPRVPIKDSSGAEAGITRDTTKIQSLYQNLIDRAFGGDRMQSANPKYDNFISRPEQEIIKCFTPVIKTYEEIRPTLTTATRQQLDQLLATGPLDSVETDTLLSSSGKFRLLYTTTGQDSVPAVDQDNNGYPDYVEQAAKYADSVWIAEIARLNYANPLQQQGTPYEIYFADTREHYGQAYYGVTSKYRSRGATFMVVHHNFNGFPPNTDPEGDRIGSLKVTLAHEFKHAINYFVTHWQGEVDRWAEMDATLMEDLVFDPVNDYYNYISSFLSIFNAPGVSMYPGSYEHVTFALYFTQNFGAHFWSDLWDRIRKSGNGPQALPMIPAIDSTLSSYSTKDFAYHFTRNHLWHFATGPVRVAPEYGFTERFAEFNGHLAYPGTTIAFKYDSAGVPDSLSEKRSLDNLSAQHISIVPQRDDNGPVQVRVKYDSSQIGVGLIAYRGGRVETIIKTSKNDSAVTLTPDWWWGGIERLGVVVTNPDPNSLGSTYQIRYGTLDDPVAKTQLPTQPQLEPNFPNPFNNSTNLVFMLPHIQDVTIKIYDVTGRLLRTIQKGRMSAGRHVVPFNADRLASGVYFYRLITEENVQVGKMTLLK